MTAKPKPKVTINPLTSNEIPACFRLLSKSFGHDAPFVDMYFPAHDTAAGQVAGCKRLLAWERGTPESVFLKATIAASAGESESERGSGSGSGNAGAGAGETGTVSVEKIIGFAVWTLMKEPPPEVLEEVENVMEVWPDEEGRAFMAQLWRSYVQLRSKAIRDSSGKGVYVLELLAVHPDYQRLGAGRGLVTWGTKKADEIGVKAIVEGTPVGRPLYERCGFEVKVEEMAFEVDERFQGRRKPELVFMSRDPLMLWGPLMLG